MINQTILRRLFFFTVIVSLATQNNLKAQSLSVIGDDEPGWTNIINSESRTIKVQDSSLQKKGKEISANFAIFMRGYSESKKSLYFLGTGNFCGSSLKFSHFIISNEDLGTGNFYGAEADDKASYYLRTNLEALDHYICNNINPNYLKVGMSMQEAKKLLYKNNFKIVEQNQSGHRHDSICDTKKSCIINGNHEYDYITFKNRKTGVQLNLGFFENNLYTISFANQI